MKPTSNIDRNKKLRASIDKLTSVLDPIDGLDFRSLDDVQSDICEALFTPNRRQRLLPLFAGLFGAISSWVGAGAAAATKAVTSAVGWAGATKAALATSKSLALASHASGFLGTGLTAYPYLTGSQGGSQDTNYGGSYGTNNGGGYNLHDYNSYYQNYHYQYPSYQSPYYSYWNDYGGYYNYGSFYGRRKRKTSDNDDEVINTSTFTKKEWKDLIFEKVVNGSMCAKFDRGKIDTLLTVLPYVNLIENITYPGEEYCSNNSNFAAINESIQNFGEMINLYSSNQTIETISTLLQTRDMENFDSLRQQVQEMARINAVVIEIMNSGLYGKGVLGCLNNTIVSTQFERWNISVLELWLRWNRLSTEQSEEEILADLETIESVISSLNNMTQIVQYRFIETTTSSATNINLSFIGLAIPFYIRFVFN